jgi:short-subunit dehydrogenase
VNADFWKQRTCLVTGASAGLGFAIAEALAERGARVALVARHRESLHRAASVLQASGAEVAPVAADVTREEDVQRLADAVRARWGGLDMLCNCAGRSTRSDILSATPEDFRQLLEVNLVGAVHTTRALAGDLLHRRGSLVNVGSLACRVAPRYMGAYPASKFALAAYTQQVRLELGPQGLHVLLVCPGPIRREQAPEAARYADSGRPVPDSAQRPGGGAKVRALDPQRLARQILAACERRRSELIVPRHARLLFVLAQASPALGDWLLRRFTSG